ncbi:MAG: RHS repeat-associated core domain-containing protein [Kiritimatiellae bacterium]|nr:RHS repeat-associated core domain-containing protein [Kiritimatiellia bacterium]
MTAKYASDILDRVTNITYRTAGGGLVRSFAYAYDLSGLITQQVTEAGDGQTVTNSYAYDGLGRLVSESFTQSGTNALTQFSYDLAGNRLSVSSEFSVVNNTYTHNRLTAASDGTSLAYDAAGCVTSIVSASSASSARKLTWNAQRQLVSVSTNGVFAESYAYDALGRRVSTTDSSGTVFHIYDGDECAADVDADGNPLRSYAWGPGIDDLLAVTVYSSDATNTYYASKDQLGSVHALVDASGSVVESYSYSAWGEATILSSGLSPLPSSQFGNRYLFQGREYSFATGLYNFRARWYEPRLGRWLSNDPIGISGGLNLYAFCGNNPVNYVDPEGTDIWVGRRGIHKNINVGNPKGTYKSYSLCLPDYITIPWINIDVYPQIFNPFNEAGEIYGDCPPNSIDKSRYLKTTPEQDAEALKILNEMEGDKMRYRLIGSQCRTFSHDMFKFFKSEFNSNKRP